MVCDIADDANNSDNILPPPPINIKINNFNAHQNNSDAFNTFDNNTSNKISTKDNVKENQNKSFSSDDSKTNNRCQQITINNNCSNKNKEENESQNNASKWVSLMTELLRLLKSFSITSLQNSKSDEDE